MQIPRLAGLDEFLTWEEQQRYEFAEGAVSCFLGAMPNRAGRSALRVHERCGP